MKNIKHWAYASALLLLVFILWAYLIITKLFVILPVSIIAIKRDYSVIFGKCINWKQWRYNLWISDDQNVNAMLGGDRDITVSSRVGFNAKRGNEIALKMEKVIDLLFKITINQDNHCRASIERDETHNKNWGG